MLKQGMHPKGSANSVRDVEKFSSRLIQAERNRLAFFARV